MRLFAVLVAVFVAVAAANGHEAENPLLDAARQLLENSLAGKDGGQGAALLQGLAGAFAASKEGGGAGAADLLGGLGSLLAATQGGGGGGQPADLLGGLGSLLAATQGRAGGQQPDLLATVADLFSQQAAGGGGGQEQHDQPAGGGNGGGFDWENMIGMASSFMQAQGGGQNQGAEGLLTLLPLFMGGGQAGQSNIGQIWQTAQNAFNHFRQSELAQSLWKSSGLDKLTTRFLDSDGHFDVHRVFESLSNHQFRRTWIRTLTAFVADWLSHLADPAAQNKYASISRSLLDGAMKSHGLAPFDPTRPGHSIATLGNALMRRHMGSTSDFSHYVKPAVDYVWELLQIGRTTSQGLGLAKMPARQIEARLGDALNAELIEPVLRVWRAYRFAHKNTKCGRYVLCQAAKEARDMPGVGLKPAVTKVASLVATWYLADDVHSSFWDLYAAANSSTDCQDVFHKGCDEFLIVDKKATVTKYVHNEL